MQTSVRFSFARLRGGGQYAVLILRSHVTSASVGSGRFVPRGLRRQVRELCELGDCVVARKTDADRLWRWLEGFTDYKESLVEVRSCR